MSASDSQLVPPRRTWMTWGFYRFLPRYLARHFHMVGVSGDSLPTIPTDEPLIVCLNHPGWWDPLILLILRTRYFPDREFFAPIDAAALRGYPIFRQLGFFGVEQNTTRGARQFLGAAREILARPAGSLWLTPEGRFTDPRDQPAFEPGLAHLVSGMTRGTVLPLAIEYAYWTERTPEALVRFGTPLRISELGSLDKAGWQTQLETALRATQAELARETIARDRSKFTPLLLGGTGVGGFYDWWRTLRGWWTGDKSGLSHEGLMS